MSNEPISSNSQTDWQRLDAMNDEDIDLSDCPEVSPEQFAKAVVKRGLPVAKTKAQVTLRIDRNVYEFTTLKTIPFVANDRVLDR